MGGFRSAFNLNKNPKNARQKLKVLKQIFFKYPKKAHTKKWKEKKNKNKKINYRKSNNKTKNIQKKFENLKNEKIIQKIAFLIKKKYKKYSFLEEKKKSLVLVFKY